MDLMTHSTKSGKKPLYKWQFNALGTNWSIDTPTSLPDGVSKEINQQIEMYDKTYSRFRTDSLVWQLRTPGEYEFPDNIVPLLTLYKKLYELTDGRMTPLIGGLLEQAGYDANYTFKQHELTDVPKLEALGWNGNVMICPNEPLLLDVGAAGKGQLVDEVAEILEKHDINEYVIDASGDIKHRGEQTIIGLENPADATKIIGTTKLQNKSLCASAINRRVWGTMHHVFDPYTKHPTSTMLATWVVADSTMVADALATALFFVSHEVLKNEFDFEYVTVGANGTVDVSPNFEGELFI